MCILFIAIAQHPEYPLIVAANRDEYFARPSEPMQFWRDHPEILAGRDKQAGGSWLGMNRNGQFAAVTNFRDKPHFREDARSRGELVTRFLAGDYQHEHIDQFHQFLDAEHDYYNPFNLIYGNSRSVWAWNHVTNTSTQLSPGFHSVSNGPIDQPWPKMSRGVEKLTHTIHNSRQINVGKLIDIMRDTTQADASLLPDTGVGSVRERQLSSIFVHSDDYGTRTTSLLLFSNTEIAITECNYSREGAPTSLLDFKITQ